MVLNFLLQESATVGSGGYNGLVMIALIFVVMYFFMIRPQQKQKKKIEEQRKALKAGDEVITSGGIHGKLRGINDTSYIIEISEGVKITVDKISVLPIEGDFNQKKKK